MKNDFIVLRSKGLKLVVCLGALVAASGAHADMAAMTAAITGAVDYDAIVTAIGVIMAAIAVVLVAFKGGKMLLAALR